MGEDYTETIEDVRFYVRELIICFYISMILLF